MDLRAALLIGLLLGASHPACRSAREGTPPLDVEPAAAGSPEAVDFDTRVRPVLEARCQPCHFPGGQMYGSLPFDRPETIREHPEGILKRIDDAEEQALLRSFLAGG